ncbi:M50 family metallopeptidase [Janibacter sp. G56]|uniref:M50 family metallopeptidase n=1 Tax=Janibacter sp. G56 TaxID=3418717 RepID=UPI003D0562F5
MDDGLLTGIAGRLLPAAHDVTLGASELSVVLLLALAAVAIDPLWRVLRVGITLVHELGHAGVGVLVGRQFTGFVVRGDMSGHAVTRGPARGPGQVASTWAGYPAPAVVGAVLTWLAGTGWAGPGLAVILVGLLIALIRVRSALTAIVVMVALGATFALWWWADDTVRAQVLVGVGIVLVVGAWRHLGAVLRGGRSSDPGVLAHLTGVPTLVWTASFALVCGLASWVVVATLGEAWS